MVGARQFPKVEPSPTAPARTGLSQYQLNGSRCRTPVRRTSRVLRVTRVSE